MAERLNTDNLHIDDEILSINLDDMDQSDAVPNIDPVTSPVIQTGSENSEELSIDNAEAYAENGDIRYFLNHFDDESLTANETITQNPRLNIKLTTANSLLSDSNDSGFEAYAQIQFENFDLNIIDNSNLESLEFTQSQSIQEEDLEPQTHHTAHPQTDGSENTPLHHQDADLWVEELDIDAEDDSDMMGQNSFQMQTKSKRDDDEEDEYESKVLDSHEMLLGNIEGSSKIIGSEADDKIMGTDGRDRIFGGEGNDKIYGQDGNDRLYGGRGDDFLSGGSGRDVLIGGRGQDTLLGDDGNDRLFGGHGNDTLRGGDGHDRLYGGRGDDYIAGDDGNDRLFGSQGNDTLDGGAGNDFLRGGSGDDSIFGGLGNDRLYGGTGDDHLIGGEGRDLLVGGRGNDWLEGGEGNDILLGVRGDNTLSGGDGNDWLIGGRGNDNLDGGNGNDILWSMRGDNDLSGGDGNDWLIGGWGNDELTGGAGNDLMVGGYGHDTFHSGQGDDRAWGGAGDDLFIFGEGTNNNTFHGGSGNWTDTISLNMDINSIHQDQSGSWVLSSNGEQLTMSVDQGFDVNTGVFDSSASGQITLADGSKLEFDDIEQLTWNNIA